MTDGPIKTLRWEEAILTKLRSFLGVLGCEDGLLGREGYLITGYIYI